MRWPIRRPLPLGAVLAAIAGALPAAAHVAPSRDTNNRYYVINPMADRIRLVYIVFMGDEPGRLARPRLDQDKDRFIDEQEAQVWGDEIAIAVREALDVRLDGQPVTLQWAEVDVGLGTPSVEAGAFSVDLVAWLCLPDRPTGDHKLELFDHFHLPNPGESGLSVQAEPGVKISRSSIGPDGVSRPLHGWKGGPGQLDDLGFHLQFRAIDGQTSRPELGPCVDEAASREAPRRRWPLWAAGLGGACALGLALWLAVRRRAHQQVSGTRTGT